MAPSEEHPRLTRIVKEKSKNGCDFENTMATSGVYSGVRIGQKTKINGHVQANSTDSGLDSMLIVDNVVVKLLRARRIRFTIDYKPTKSSKHVLVSTSTSPVHGIALSDRTLYCTPPHYEQSRKRVNENRNTFRQSTTNTCQNKKAVTTKPVCAGPRPTGTTGTVNADDKSLNRYGKLDNKNSLKEHQMDKQRPQGENGDDNSTLNRDQGTTLTPRGEGGSLSTPWYGGSTTLTSKRDNIKCVTIFKSNRRRENENSKSTEANFSKLKYLCNLKNMTVPGQRA